METLNEFIEQVALSPDWNILGKGSNSIVWENGNKIYKLTSELSKEDANEFMNKNNHLIDDCDINVPRVFSVNTFSVGNPALVANLHRALREDAVSYTKLLEVYANQYKDNFGEYVYVAICEEKVKGDVCFDVKNYHYLSQMKNMSEHLKTRTVPPPFQKNLFEEMDLNLDYFNSIPKEHYVKFVKDAAKLKIEGIALDNIFQNNFIYDFEKGFYFIDIDGLKNSRLQSSTIFDPTVDNVCRMLYLPKCDLPKHINEKAYLLCQKLEEVIEEFQVDEIGKSFCLDYMGSDNLFSKFYKYSASCVSYADKNDKKIDYESKKLN